MEENKNVIAETGDKEEVVSKNFIEREIDKDLAEGVIAMSKPDSQRNPTDIFILVMPSPLF